VLVEVSNSRPYHNHLTCSMWKLVLPFVFSIRITLQEPYRGTNCRSGMIFIALAYCDLSQKSVFITFVTYLTTLWVRAAQISGDQICTATRNICGSVSPFSRLAF